MRSKRAPRVLSARVQRSPTNIEILQPVLSSLCAMLAGSHGARLYILRTESVQGFFIWTQGVRYASCSVISGETACSPHVSSLMCVLCHALPISLAPHPVLSN
jgi:hypothetical protein